MKHRIRNTQKSLLFGIYLAAKGSLNPGLSIWWNGRYVWPRKRHKVVLPKEGLLFQVVEPGDGATSA